LAEEKTEDHFYLSVCVVAVGSDPSLLAITASLGAGASSTLLVVGSENIVRVAGSVVALLILAILESREVDLLGLLLLLLHVAKIEGLASVSSSLLATLNSGIILFQYTHKMNHS